MRVLKFCLEEELYISYYLYFEGQIWLAICVVEPNSSEAIELLQKIGHTIVKAV